MLMVARMSSDALFDLFHSEHTPWGLLTSVDLYQCNFEIITSKESIHLFCIQLCDMIQVKRFGDPVIVHFGEDKKVEGYSLVQLIETSLVSGHFANLSNSAYIDIFSCRYYAPKDVYDFCCKFFESQKGEMTITIRQ